MANEEQLAILKQGVEAWNKWRKENLGVTVDLGVPFLSDHFSIDGVSMADLKGVDLNGADLNGADLWGVDLRGANLRGAAFWAANLKGANLRGADCSAAYLCTADLRGADFRQANLRGADLSRSDLRGADFVDANLIESNFLKTTMNRTIFGVSDMSESIGLEDVVHMGPSNISTNTFVHSKGKIPEVFLRGCGLSDWEIEAVKLYNPDLNNDEITQIQYKVYELRATQALQVSPLFISYSHADREFVDKVGNSLTEKGIRYWRDIHEMKAGRMEKQIDRAISQNPTVLLILSTNSIRSDWVEHEVRTARELEKEMGRDVLCPVALDDSWKSSSWPKRVMEQVMEYNILDFSAWDDESKFDGIFRKLIDGLELFYKG